MSKIICFGEALIDLLSNKIANQNVDEESFRQFAGGAPANVSVAIAKLGGNTFFSGMLSTDTFGNFLYQSLKNNQVKTDYIKFTKKAKTALAFVSLDQDGERSFDFYRDNTADLCFQPSDFEKEWFDESGIYHFCSNSLTDHLICQSTIAGITHAKNNDWLVSFDVNLRLALWPESSQTHSTIMSVIKSADIIKMSMDELVYMAKDEGHQHFIAELLADGVSLVLITNGGEPLQWYTEQHNGSFHAKTTQVVDTTAAGDAFIGGFLFTIGQQNITKSALDDWLNNRKNIDNAVRFAGACGAHAVSIAGAFPSLPTLESVQPFING